MSFIGISFYYDHCNDSISLAIKIFYPWLQGLLFHNDVFCYYHLIPATFLICQKKKTCWLMQRLCIAFRRSMQLTLVVKAVLMPHHLIRLRILFLPLWHVHGDSIWFSAGSLFFFNLKQKNSRFFKKLGLISISNTPKSIWFSWPKKQKKKQ